MKNWLSNGLWCILSFVVTGCAHHNDFAAAEKAVAIEKAIVLPKWQISSFTLQPIESTADLFTLSDAEQTRFLTYYNAPENQHLPANKKLFNFMEHQLANFDYKGNTYIAREALEHKGGNCLSLAIVTTAYAKLTDLSLRYQKVNSVPIYLRYGDLMTVSSHVRTHVIFKEVVKNNNQKTTNFHRTIIDYFPEQGDVSGNFLTEANFVAMYYQNKAGTALIEQNYELAYAYLAAAMKLDPSNPETLNLLAVLHKKIGNERQAEQLFTFAIHQTKGSINLYSNYIDLLAQQGRTSEVERLRSLLPNIDDDNPYQWINLAEEAVALEKHRTALIYYERALKQAPYLADAYYGLAGVYYRIQQHNLAVDAVRKAIELSVPPSNEALYLAKLHQLKSN